MGFIQKCFSWVIFVFYVALYMCCHQDCYAGYKFTFLQEEHKVLRLEIVVTDDPMDISAIISAFDRACQQVAPKQDMQLISEWPDLKITIMGHPEDYFYRILARILAVRLQYPTILTQETWELLLPMTPLDVGGIKAAWVNYEWLLGKYDWFSLPFKGKMIFWLPDKLKPLKPKDILFNNIKELTIKYLRNVPLPSGTKMPAHKLPLKVQYLEKERSFVSTSSNVMDNNRKLRKNIFFIRHDEIGTCPIGMRHIQLHPLVKDRIDVVEILNFVARMGDLSKIAILDSYIDSIDIAIITDFLRHNVDLSYTDEGRRCLPSEIILTNTTRADSTENPFDKGKVSSILALSNDNISQDKKGDFLHLQDIGPEKIIFKPSSWSDIL